MEYLYAQTNKVLQAISLDPDTPDESDAVEGPLEDEGFDEETEDDDPTVHLPDPPLPASSSTSTAADDRADAPGSLSSGPAATPTDDNCPEARGHQNSPPSKFSPGSDVRFDYNLTESFYLCYTSNFTIYDMINEMFPK